MKTIVLSLFTTAAILVLLDSAYASSEGRNKVPTWLKKRKGTGIPRNYFNMPTAFQNSNQTCHKLNGEEGTTTNGVEHALWYFREDYLLNAQHLFWHTYHHNSLGEENVILMDRQGELFYYFHRNMLGRYAAERLGIGFTLIAPLNFSNNAVVPVAYDPHLRDKPSYLNYNKRRGNRVLQGIQMEKYVAVIDVIKSDVENRQLISIDNSTVSLNGKEGTEKLGLVVEAHGTNINVERYEFVGLHNTGHLLIGNLSDNVAPPEEDVTKHRKQFNFEPSNTSFNFVAPEEGNSKLPKACAGNDELPGTETSVMSDPAASMRDIIFYQWHTTLDDIFRRNWELQEPNHTTDGEFPLIWNGVSIDSVTVQRVDNPRPSNVLRTFMENLNISIPLTIDARFLNDTVNYCITRLNHDEFEYSITINKQPFIRSQEATVRIFMAAKYNADGQRFSLVDQMRYFFPMDSFTVALNPGVNTITRRSSESTLSLKWKLETWEEHTPNAEEPECACGWPSHLLLPRGNEEGQAFDLFVMVTDAEVDIEEYESVATPAQEERCTVSRILCSPKTGKYPDIRPLGYPFNTLPFSVSTNSGGQRVVADVDEYAGLLPNSKVVEVIIRHGDILDDGGEGVNGSLDLMPKLFVVSLLSALLFFLH